MRVIHGIPFTPSEIEHYRQLVFDNLTHGLRYVLNAMVDMELAVLPENMSYVDMIDDAPDLRGGQPFPLDYEIALRALWEDENVKKAWERGNEAALPEK